MILLEIKSGPTWEILIPIIIMIGLGFLLKILERMKMRIQEKRDLNDQVYEDSISDSDEMLLMQ